MYTLKQIRKAIKLLIKYDMAYTQTIRELGYPNSRTTLRRWYSNYIKNGKLNKNYHRNSKYSDQEIQKAVNYYLNHGKSISRTCRKLGYPSRPVLIKWIQEYAPKEKKITKAGGYMLKCSQEKKVEAVLDFSIRDDSINNIAKAHGVSRVSLYKWSKELLTCEGYTMAKNEKKFEDNISIECLEKEKEELLENLKQLKIENEKLKFENDILEKAAELIKKEEGINLDDLNNFEKMTLINALKNKYKLNRLLKRLNIAKSSYFYQVSRLKRGDKYQILREKIREIFYSAYQCYGYRRIHQSLKNNGIIISEKVVRRLMAQEGLYVVHTKKKKYSSYLGEISPAVENVIDRDFSSNEPNEKWLTDITEFSIPAGKIYLSPIIDCFDGLPVSWTIGTSPNADLVNTMLDNAIDILTAEEKPIIHSDRGAHYRWPGWIERVEQANLTRSMSKKGCSPDNSACEGFFGTIKQEMFYSKSFNDVSIKQFINYLNKYLMWYCKDRIKCSLNGMSPINYRISKGIQV